MAVVLETSLGNITVDLFVKQRPRACLNFLKLCKIKYYNYCTFFNVQRDFIAQTGDPTGTGKGGESVFKHVYGEQAAFFEPESEVVLNHVSIGTVSMANNGNDMHGSQFFITLAANLDYLDGKHTVFGEVSEGLEVLEKLNQVIVDDDMRPYQDIRINHTIILDDPFPDPSALEIPSRSPSPTKEQLESSRLTAGETLEETGGLSEDQAAELLQEKEARARAQILEMVGDLPDADVKPPDNVLFVCKLNPVTSDEDLMVIFSRFGPIKSCEVIRDQKTGDSLQYAFVEFEEADHCANAYFKMDNVLIDDRRIHVDFSQSVSKLDFPRKPFSSSKSRHTENSSKSRNDRSTNKQGHLPKRNDNERSEARRNSPHSSSRVRGSRSELHANSDKQSRSTRRSRSRSFSRHERSHRRRRSTSRSDSSSDRKRKPESRKHDSGRYGDRERRESKSSRYASPPRRDRNRR